MRATSPPPSPQLRSQVGENVPERDILTGAETDAALFIYFSSRKHLDFIFTNKAGKAGPGCRLS